MPAPYRPLSVRDFREEVHTFRWSRRVWRVDVHHTMTPADDYSGLNTLEDLARRHLEKCAQAQPAHHVAVAPDGAIWTGRDWNMSPASVGCGMNVGVFMVALIGNFDRGHDRLTTAQLGSALAAVEAVQHHFHLPVHALLFPREVPQTETSSPGTGIEKRDILLRLLARRPPSGSQHAAAVA